MREHTCTFFFPEEDDVELLVQCSESRNFSDSQTLQTNVVRTEPLSSSKVRLGA